MPVPEEKVMDQVFEVLEAIGISFLATSGHPIAHSINPRTLLFEV